MAAPSSITRTQAVVRRSRMLYQSSRIPVSPRGTIAWAIALLVTLASISPGEGYPVASADEWSAGFDYLPCEGMMYGEEPKLDYMMELFERMVRMDRLATTSPGGGALWERIIAIEKLRSTAHTHWLTFNISSLSDADKMTMAKVAVVTCGRKNSCQPSLKENRQKRRLPCENNPFMVYDLATVDVTSLLASRLGEHRFHIYAKRMGHLETALLVIFHGVNTAQLLQDPEPVRFEQSVFRKKREARGIPSLQKRRGMERDAIPGGSRRQHVQPFRRPAGSPKGKNHEEAFSGESGVNIPDIQNEVVGQAKSRGGRQSLHEKTPGVRPSKETAETLPSDEPKRLDPGWGSHRKNVKERPDQLTRKGNRYVSTDRQLARGKHKLRPRRKLSNARHAPVFETPNELLRHLNERRKRSAAGVNLSETAEPYTRSSDSCQLKNFTVLPLEDLNIPGFISPRYLDIGSCEGECPPILHPSDRVPQYSHITSLLHFRWPNAGWPVPPPSCRPRRFQSFSVMRWVGDDIVIERWVNARVIECGCV